MVFVQAGEKSVEFFLAFAGKDDSFGEDSVFEGVLRGASFTFLSAGPGAELCIGLIGGLLFVRGHEIK